MKKRTILLVLLLILSLSACGNDNAGSAVPPAAPSNESGAEPGSDSAPAGDPAPASLGKALVVDFSTPGLDGVDAVSRASANLDGNTVVGNTEHIAMLVADAAGADTFRVETVKEYPEEIEDLLEYAYGETQNNERPELAAHIENLEDYDTVFIGVPVWNYQMPMAMYSFFDEYDFTGKTIAVFTTHRGSRLSGIPEDIAELEPGATVLTDGYTVGGDDAFAVAQEDISKWVGTLFSE